MNLQGLLSKVIENALIEMFFFPEICGTTFTTSGQRLTPGQCSSGIVWKPEPNVAIPLTYSSWFAGEPNCGGGTESCANFWSDKSYAWNDNNCDTPGCPVCQYTGVYVDHYNILKGSCQFTICCQFSSCYLITDNIFG